MVQDGKKKCCKCGEMQSVDNFWNSKTKGDGYQYYCKDCQKKAVCKSSSHRNSNKKRKNHATPAQRKNWRDSNQEKVRAHRVFHNAMRDMGVCAPSTCSLADSSCYGKIEAHHPDYSKPLKVKWMCASHHRRLHNVFYTN